jgi:hypothetical protein
VTPPSTTSTTIPAGLVAAYGFDENQGATTADASGRGNTGTLTATTWTTAGRIGNALVFNGMTSWVTAADSASLDLTTAMTVEAWVFPTATLPQWVSLVSKEQAGSLAYFLYARGTSGPAQGVFTGGAERILYATGALTANTWTHVAATYDGAQQRLYVNGTQVAIRAQTGAIAASTLPLRIGGNTPYGNFFTGRIDEVRVYNRALTQPEIAADMTRPVP